MSKTLNEQAQEILKIAEESGVQSNFFFRTTFQRYLVQVDNATRIERQLKALKDADLTVTKSYQKGANNAYINPLISEYNKTTDSANKTVSTIMRILRNFGVSDGEEEKEKDDLMAAINGGDDYEETD